MTASFSNVELATSIDPALRQPTVAVLIEAVEASEDMLPAAPIGKEGFELESERPPPMKPGAKAAPKPTAKTEDEAAAKSEQRPQPPIGLGRSIMPSAPPKLEAKWLAVAILAPIVLAAMGFFADLPESVAYGLSWGAALVATFAVLRATASFPLRASLAFALLALIGVATLDPVGAAARAGVELRLRGSPRAREKQVRSLIERGRKSFPRENWSGMDMSGANLMMVDVSQGDLSNANFTRANLAGLIADRTNVAGANFEGADMRDVDIGQMVGWETARCSPATKLGDGWACSGAKLVKVDSMAGK